MRGCAARLPVAGIEGEAPATGNAATS